MEYANAAWMHDVGSRPHESALTNHDPIITDTNLAEIDFEDFRNEDLAYAFSCGVSCYQGLLYIPKVCFYNSNLKKIKCYQLRHKICRRKNLDQVLICQYVVPRFFFPQ